MLLKEIAVDNYKSPAMQKAIKVGVTNDYKQTISESKPKTTHHTTLSIEVDFANKKKVVTIPTKEEMEITNKNKESKPEDLFESKRHSSHPVVEKGGGTKDPVRDVKKRESDDYTSPLDAFDKTT